MQQILDWERRATMQRIGGYALLVVIVWLVWHRVEYVERVVVFAAFWAHVLEVGSIHVLNPSRVLPGMNDTWGHRIIISFPYNGWIDVINNPDILRSV